MALRSPAWPLGLTVSSRRPAVWMDSQLSDPGTIGIFSNKSSPGDFWSHLPPLQWRHNGRDSVSNHQLLLIVMHVFIRHCSFPICSHIHPISFEAGWNNSYSAKMYAKHLIFKETQSFIQTQIKENINAPRHWPLCGEFTGTGEFPAQMASNAENVSIWWRHHDHTDS